MIVCCACCCATLDELSLSESIDDECESIFLAICDISIFIVCISFARLLMTLLICSICVLSSSRATCATAATCCGVSGTIFSRSLRYSSALTAASSDDEAIPCFCSSFVSSLTFFILSISIIVLRRNGKGYKSVFVLENIDWVVEEKTFIFSHSHIRAFSVRYHFALLALPFIQKKKSRVMSDNGFKQWVVMHLKHKDLFRKEITELREDDKKVFVRTEKGVWIVHVREHLVDSVPIGDDLKTMIFCLNTSKNKEWLIKNWESVKKQGVTLYFVNPESVTDRFWAISPLVHSLVTDTSHLRQGIQSLFDTVQEVVE